MGGQCGDLARWNCMTGSLMSQRSRLEDLDVGAAESDL
jgi:hypothetical protein